MPEPVHPTTCILSGQPGEDPDDCTTHDHEEPLATALQRLEQRTAERLVAATDAFNEAFDDDARLTVVTRLLDVVEQHPTAHAVSLMDWEDEAGDGEPFDVDLYEVLDARGDELADVAGESGSFPIRHHWTLDPLRVDPQAAGDDKGHPGALISVAKARAWLAARLAEMEQEGTR